MRVAFGSSRSTEEVPAWARVDYLINIAAATNGHAGVNSNDLAPAVDAIFIRTRHAT